MLGVRAQENFSQTLAYIPWFCLKDKSDALPAFHTLLLLSSKHLHNLDKRL